MIPSHLSKVLLQLVPARKPFLLVGPPGVGKTEIVEQVADALNFECIVTHPVVDDPVDYKGMPAVIQGDTGARAQFLPFGELSRMVEATVPTLVLMDDLGQAPPAVQAAIMQLVLARRINGHAISEHVTFAAATNRREDKAAVTGLITPLLDRFATVINVEFDLDDWIAWGLDNGMPVELLAFARLKHQVIGKFEASKDMKKSPTPRSLAGLGHLVNMGLLDPEVVTGAIGDLGNEFLSFHNMWRLIPDRNEIYLNPDRVPVPEEPSVLYALMGSLSYGASVGNIDATVRYLARVSPEFSVFCIKDAVARDKSLAHTRAFNEWARANAAAMSYSRAA
jgi:hypothetical protein